MPFQQVVFTKDPSKDYVKEGIAYKGQIVTWTDGTPVSMSIEKLCETGVKTVLGKDAQDEQYTVGIETFFVKKGEPIIKKSDGYRRRRLYVQKEEGGARVYFHNGMITEILISPNDDPRVIELFGIDRLAQEEQVWFDVKITTISSGNTH